jgi:hypothetical protein
MKIKIAALKDDMAKEKEAAINLEVRRALEEAAKNSESGQAEYRKDELLDKSGEEK